MDFQPSSPISVLRGNSYFDLVRKDGELFCTPDTTDLRCPTTIALQDDNLVYSYEPPTRVRLGKLDRETLSLFIELDTAPAEQILAFARRYGVLHYSEDGEPCRWRPMLRQPRAPEAQAQELISQKPPDLQAYEPGAGPTYSQPLSIWRHFARQFKASLNIAASLRDGKMGAKEDYAQLFADESDYAHLFTKRHQPKQISTAQQLLLTAGNEFVRAAGIHPKLIVVKEKPVFKEHGYDELFSALVYQVVLLISGKEGLAVCCGCNRPYSPTRRPAFGRLNFCPKCGRPESNRLSAERGRKKRPQKGISRLAR